MPICRANTCPKLERTLHLSRFSNTCDISMYISATFCLQSGFPWMSPEMVTGHLTGWTLLSACRISLARSHSCFTSFSPWWPATKQVDPECCSKTVESQHEFWLHKKNAYKPTNLWCWLRLKKWINSTSYFAGYAHVKKEDPKRHGAVKGTWQPSQLIIQLSHWFLLVETHRVLLQLPSPYWERRH